MLSGPGAIPSSDLKSFLSWAKASDDFIRYTLSDGTSETQDNGELYRAVIQAGGIITASFTNNLSNTTSGAGHVGTTIATPTLPALRQHYCRGWPGAVCREKYYSHRRNAHVRGRYVNAGLGRYCSECPTG
ncbi:hypothetical protein ABC733_27680 [Mangrovibacter sp. SLW1]